MANNIKKELNKILDKSKVSEDEIKNILINGVLKRDVIESDEAKAASIKYNKILKKAKKKKENNTKKIE